MTFVPPVDLLNARSADTGWGNLGDWSRSRTEAAEALAVRLGHAADLRPGLHVLDAGAGAGDQVRTWIDHFGVARVTVLECDPGLAAAARSLAARRGWASRVEVHVGDAARMRLEPESVDRVVSLDAAYFFRRRDDFLKRGHDALRPGGRLALADLVLGSGGAGVVARALAPVFQVPRANLWTPPGWVASLEAIGFDDVELVDCTDAVLGGFARWSRTGVGTGPGSRVVRAVGSVGGALARRRALGYAMVTAGKPSASPGANADQPTRTGPS